MLKSESAISKQSVSMEEKGRQILRTVVSIKRILSQFNVSVSMRKADLGESIQSFATNIPNLSQNSPIECILMSHRESQHGLFCIQRGGLAISDSRTVKSF